MSTYRSQFAQDEWVSTSVFPGLRGGYFVELGAGDGVYLSNTYVLENDHGWTGLCIEPTVAVEKLRRRRSCHVDPAYVAGEAGEIRFVDAGYFSGIAGSFSKKKAPSGKVRSVQATTLGDLLRGHKAPATMQYLSLDTEGSEYAILESFPFEEFTFQAITVEHNNHVELRNSLRTLLSAKGYQRIQSIAEEDWWIHESIADTVGASCRDTELWLQKSRARMLWVQRLNQRLKRLRARAKRPKPIRVGIDVLKRRAPWLHRATRSTCKTLRGLSPKRR